MAKRKHPAGVFIRFFALLLIGITLSGCFDLGDYGYEGHKEGEIYDAYYSAFGDVIAIYGEGMNTYGIESSLLNKKTMNDFEWDTDNGQEPVEAEKYIYIAIPVEMDIQVESVSLYLNAVSIPSLSGPASEQTSASVTVSMFLLQSAVDIPSKIRKRGDPETEEADDPDNPGETITKEIEYDDPSPETALGSRSFVIKKGEWVSFTLDKWTVGGEARKRIDALCGNVLLLRFENNTGYAEDTSECAFTFMDLLVRSAD